MYAELRKRPNCISQVLYWRGLLDSNEYGVALPRLETLWRFCIETSDKNCADWVAALADLGYESRGDKLVVHLAERDPNHNGLWRHKRDRYARVESGLTFEEVVKEYRDSSLYEITYLQVILSKARQEVSSSPR